jgi:predicted TIM-barrel fold metal-dependent hydrolase
LQAIVRLGGADLWKRGLHMDNDALVIISSDGHAGALMADYRPYLDEKFRDEFDDFLVEWNDHGSRNIDLPALKMRLDPDVIEEWNEKMVATGRIDAFPDSHRRLKEQEREGVTAEVVFPDFGLPFQLYSESMASALGKTHADEEHKQAGMRAFNRWMVDYMSVAPKRFAGMAAVSWQMGVEDAIADIRWASEAGFKGILLPNFDQRVPLYSPIFEPVWQTLEDLNMVVNSHGSMSSTSNQPIFTPDAPHQALAFQMFVPQQVFFTHNLLRHLISGCVLEKHPQLRVVFTEVGSSWVVGVLRDMDYVYEGSYFRTDYRDLLPSKPSEYFQRQCFLGSSIFSRAEVAARHEIGIEKMMLGMDIPHHEGTLLETTKEYLRATLGASNVPLEEARRLLGLNAAAVFGFDLDQLGTVATQVGLRPEDVLTPPDRDLFPRGDVHKPASVSP